MKSVELDIYDVEYKVTTKIDKIMDWSVWYNIDDPTPYSFSHEFYRGMYQWAHREFEADEIR